ncbi:YnfE family protein [Bacillus vallismortis]|uniref:YnfE family protein n=1 Tax=Bacillus TaxID=1386 RepID=UPI000B43BA00|nr:MULTISPECIES: YnfE family protein [Bacillus]MBL3646992.1 YnfE family protein [Bacillus sp. RHFS10]MDM5301985.1 YnfE family protein [Bacillus subtilis]MDM5324038.1 YnfE family protein [Bacillus subtilis]
MDDILKQYMVLFKHMNDVINGPDYPGKEKDIQNQKEQIEPYETQLQQRFSTDYDYDEFADSAIKCAYGDMTLEDLEAVYYELTTPFYD